MKNYPEEETAPWFDELGSLAMDAIGYYSTEDTASALLSGDLDLDDLESIYADVASMLNGRIIIKEGVTSVGNYAFSGWKATEIQLPDSLKTIGEFAFEGNQVTELEIPDGVEYIKDGAFYGMPLVSIDFPETLKELGADVCGGYELEDITLRGNPNVDSEAIEILCHPKNQYVPFPYGDEYRRFLKVSYAADRLGWLYITVSDRYERAITDYKRQHHCSYDFAEAYVAVDYMDVLLSYNTEFQTTCKDMDEMCSYLFGMIQNELGVRIGSIDAIVEAGNRIYPNDGGSFVPAEFTEDFIYLLENSFGESYEDMTDFGQTTLYLGEKDSRYEPVPWLVVFGFNGKVSEKLAKASGVAFIDLNGDNGEEEPTGGCAWCGRHHTGFFDGIIVFFFHRILASIFGARY